MGDLGAIGQNSLAAEGPLGGIGGVENSLKEGPGYKGDLAIAASGSSSGTLTLAGSGTLSGSAVGDSTATVVLLGLTNQIICAAAGDSGMGIVLTGPGNLILAATADSTATVAFTGAPTAILFHRASSRQPIFFRQDYPGFHFWQRRVSARQPRVRRL